MKDPEFNLASACCRPAGDARERAVISASKGIEWGRFERIIERHRVEGLAFEALRRAGVQVEPETANRLRAKATEIARSGLIMAAETVRLQSRLDAAAIPNLVLKGAVIDMLAWGRVGLKRAWDIDLLVLPTDALRARIALEQAGYELVDPADGSPAAFTRWVGLSKECVLVNRDNGIVLELHWRLTDVAALLPALDASSAAQVTALSSTLQIRGLTRAALIAYLCVHGASHAWSRLKWLADVGAILAIEDEAGRASLYRATCEMGAGNCAAAAFWLCEHVLGLPLPAVVAREIRSNWKARRLADLAMAALCGDGGEKEPSTRRWLGDLILASPLLFADGWAFRWKEASRLMVSVDDQMRLRLDPRVAFLYGPIRAPLWLWRRLARSTPRT